MKSITRLLLVVGLVATQSKPISAAGLDADQLKLINETAAGVCDTIKEAIGKKTQIQIEGEVSTKLKGLVGKLVDAGVGTKGSFSQEEFEGLSQEATADALQSSQACRERLFNKMFDKMGSLPSPEETYAQKGKRDDLRYIQNFLRYVPVNVTRARDEYVCQASDGEYSTRELRFGDTHFEITNFDRTSGERCTSGFRAVRETTLTCSARLSDLDEAIGIWSPPELQVNCLSGDCFSCSTSEKWKNKDNPNWQNDSRQFPISYIRIHVGGAPYAAEDDNNFLRQVNVAKAISRVISNGSLEAFCERKPHFCKGVYE